MAPYRKSPSCVVTPTLQGMDPSTARASEVFVLHVWCVAGKATAPSEWRRCSSLGVPAPLLHIAPKMPLNLYKLPW